MLYEQVEPFGAIRDNYHAAIIAKMVADVSGSTKKDKKPFVLEDLLLRVDEVSSKPPAKQDWRFGLAIAKAVAMIQNQVVTGKVKAKDL